MSAIEYTNENTVILTLARMNPPTPGHLYLIQRLIEEAMLKNIDHVYVILSKTNDDKKNPIPCEAKKKVLGESDYESVMGEPNMKMINALKTKMIRDTKDEKVKEKIKNTKVNLVCVPETKGATPFTPIYPIIEELKVAHEANNPPSCKLKVNLHLIVGDDRAELLDALSSFYYKLDHVHQVDGNLLPREEIMEKCGTDTVTISSIPPIAGMSATYVRKLVSSKDRSTFNEVYGPYLDELNIENLYLSIEKGLELKSPKPAKEKNKTATRKRRFPHTKGVPEIWDDPLSLEVELEDVKSKSKSKSTTTTKRVKRTGGKKNRKKSYHKKRS